MLSASVHIMISLSSSPSNCLVLSYLLFRRLFSLSVSVFFLFSLPLNLSLSSFFCLMWCVSLCVVVCVGVGVCVLLCVCVCVCLCVWCGVVCAVWCGTLKTPMCRLKNAFRVYIQNVPVYAGDTRTCRTQSWAAEPTGWQESERNAGHD